MHCPLSVHQHLHRLLLSTHHQRKDNTATIFFALSAAHRLHNIATACSCCVLSNPLEDIASTCSCCVIHAICHCVTTTLLPALAASGSGRGGEGGGGGIGRWQRQGWQRICGPPLPSFSHLTFHFSLLGTLERAGQKKKTEEEWSYFSILICNLQLSMVLSTFKNT